MKKRTREKVALLVFALLVVLGGSVLLRYFETGRSFNMAATAVDVSLLRRPFGVYLLLAAASLLLQAKKGGKA